MPTRQFNGRTFDARPDRLDYRDRQYQPKLVSLPKQFPHSTFIEHYLPDYAGANLILDQGTEGACTGFGLAAVINYLFWKRHLESEAYVEYGSKEYVLRAESVFRILAEEHEHPPHVSARMLYHMARLYDEWPGEDYDGSSCRGGMKGWYKHGVTTEKIWPYFAGKKVKFVQPGEGWQLDAATRPLGAYYRINKDSVNDIQSAVFEVGAIYVSATVHEGWFLQPKRGRKAAPLQFDDEFSVIPIIPFDDLPSVGGHAFAIIGFTSSGFIVQNSWGPTWGYQGFAILTYADWIKNGNDAWVAVLGAPMGSASPRTRHNASLRDIADRKAHWSWRPGPTFPPDRPDSATTPWSDELAYAHTVVLANNGVPINQFLDRDTADDAVREAAFSLPLAWLSQRNRPKLAIYAHGGLNSEVASIRRIRVLAPYFEANEIYPIFITWRTGFLETIAGILEDAVVKFFAPPGTEPVRGFLDDLRQQVAEARDRVIEAACERALVKAVWTQMKQNADASTTRYHGLHQIAAHLNALRKQLPNLELHLIGHSAGAILLGHLLDLLSGKMKVESLSLFAPACTVEFANEHYLGAIEKKTISRAGMYFEILSDVREQMDAVGPYGKSILYLISRALESIHKMPLLGMQWAWKSQLAKKEAADADIWNEAALSDVRRWQKFAGADTSRMLRVHKADTVSDGVRDIPLDHSSFDNDVRVISDTLVRIRGKALIAKVESLQGF
jgi:pimeloyl-ACP methyl ester carboxylesterase